MQKSTAVHAMIYDQLDHGVHFNRRHIFNRHGSAALADWRQLGVAEGLPLRTYEREILDTLQ